MMNNNNIYYSRMQPSYSDLYHNYNNSVSRYLNFASNTRASINRFSNFLFNQDINIRNIVNQNYNLLSNHSNGNRLNNINNNKHHNNNNNNNNRQQYNYQNIHDENIQSHNNLHSFLPPPPPQPRNITPSPIHFFQMPNTNNNNNNNNNNNITNLIEQMTPVDVIPSQEQINMSSRIIMFNNISSPINSSCPITHEPFTHDEMVLQIACGHIFNNDAIRMWFQTNVRCPICRYDIRDSHNNNNNSDNDNNLDLSNNNISSSTNSIMNQILNYIRNDLSNNDDSDIEYTFLTQPDSRINSRINSRIIPLSRRQLHLNDTSMNSVRVENEDDDDDA